MRINVTRDTPCSVCGEPLGDKAFVARGWGENAVANHRRCDGRLPIDGPDVVVRDGLDGPVVAEHRITD